MADERFAASKSSLAREYGLAYSLDQKTVIRAGYGLLFGVPYDAATRQFTASPHFKPPRLWVNSLDRIHPNTLFSDPFRRDFCIRRAVRRFAFRLGRSLSSALPSTLHTPYNQQWNLSIQRSLATDMLLQVAYVGNKGTHLAWSGGGGRRV